MQSSFKMSDRVSKEEKKPILFDSDSFSQPGAGYDNKAEQQHIIIQAVEFDYRHRNLYGYYAVAAFLLVLINYIMIKERACQVSLVNGFQNYDLIQSFHLTVLIVSIIVFILSYFNFAVIIYDFKLLFYSTAALIFICSGLLIYDAVAITTAPCVSSSNFGNFIAALDTNVIYQNTNIFSAGDGIGITVFLFDVTAMILMFLTGRRFYQRC